MNTTFQFAGDTFSLFTNGKVYRDIQYVTITCGYRKIEGRWDHENQNWSKRCGNPDFDQATALAAGFLKEEPVVEATKTRKPRGKKVSPVVEALRLPEGQKARCVGGKIVIVSVKVKIAPKEQKGIEKVELKPLTGSEKQVAWANSLRAAFVKFYEASRPSFVTEFCAHTNASWWIENRHGMGITNADQRAIVSLMK